MIEIKKLMTGVFKAYVNGIDTPYNIRLANGFGGGSGKVFYDVYKGTERLNNPIVKLTLYSAKQKVMAEILKNS